MKTSGFTKQNKHNIKYPDFETAVRPKLKLQHESTEPEESTENSIEKINMAFEDFDPSVCVNENEPQKFNRSELNDLVRDLNSSKTL